MKPDLLYRPAFRVTALTTTALSVAISFTHDDAGSAAARTFTRKEA